MAYQSRTGEFLVDPGAFAGDIGPASETLLGHADEGFNAITDEVRRWGRIPAAYR